jgi:parallel beta-helix repeat protein
LHRFFLAAYLLAACVACAGSTTLGQDTTPRNCLEGDITLEQDTTLEPDCIHKARIRIAASNITLDCRNGLIDAEGRKVAILVGGKRSVTGVTIRNCRIRNAGIYIGLTEADTQKASKYSRTTLYDLTPHDITIEHCLVEDSLSVGIYIDDYVRHVTVKDTTIRNAGSTGIYLEHSSQENRIQHSILTHNGYGHPPHIRVGLAKREAIAVDSSAYNIIEGNHIFSNAAGGIFLYKNCHEHADTNPNSAPRWQHADHNLVKDNLIEDEKVGVWLASRQSRDLSKWGCGDKPYAGNRYFPDYAQHNTVEGNTFLRVGNGVIVEDDYNAILNNTFSETGQAVDIRALIRSRTLGREVVGTTISGNTIK